MTGDWERTLEDDVPKLAALIQELGVEEVEITEGGRTIRLRRAAPRVPSAAPEAAGAQLEAAETAGVVTVCAEHVGVFLRAAAGESEPLVTEGTAVEEDQPIGFVDVLGVAHDVLVPEGGVLEQFLVIDGQPVEYGQPLARLISQSGGQT